MSCKNTEAWNFSRALTQNGLNILVVISILIKHCNMWKREVAIKIYFAQKLFFLFLVNQGKLLVVSGKCLKNFYEQVHF